MVGLWLQIENKKEITEEKDIELGFEEDLVEELGDGIQFKPESN